MTEHRHALYFAVLPDEAAAARITALGRRLADAAGPEARPLAPDRLHVSLYGVGRYAVLPQAVAAEVAAAAARVVMPAFDVCFDHVAGFGGGGGRRAVVLRGGEGVTGLHLLRDALGAAMAGTSVGRHRRPVFEPHLTILYAAGPVAETDIAPIRWTVREFALVDSLQGRGRHVRLGRWRLEG